jgi:hypothetical protein
MKYSETKALMRMLEQRATWLDKWRAKRLPGHWLNQLRRDLLILSDDDDNDNPRCLLAKNREQAKMIAGYIELIGAAKDIGIYFHWEGRTARAELPRQIRIENEALWRLAHELDGKLREEHGSDKIGLEQFKAQARGSGEWARDLSERWPQVCHLCNHNMESDTDRAEWHGLGNCVPICPTCNGSGTAEEIAKRGRP